jgi:hypothetical protein
MDLPLLKNDTPNNLESQKPVINMHIKNQKVSRPINLSFDFLKLEHKFLWCSDEDEHH